MYDYEAIKALAKASKRPISEFLALDKNNDPFFVGVDFRVKSGEWFAELWHGGHQGHLRRIHYRLVSQKPPIKGPTGQPYENTPTCWVDLCRAALNARYLDLIPFDAIPDHRNSEPHFFAAEALDPNEERSVDCEVMSSFTEIETPELPELPEFGISGLDVRQDCIVEVWIEKSTQNDWLLPLCERRGVNLVVGIGQQSETRSRHLGERAAQLAVPSRVIYLSDFDSSGRSTPKAVARKVEFTLAKFSLDADVQLIPLVLTPDQIRAYNLPYIPISKERAHGRTVKFMETFKVKGPTELDAMEALHPGEMARLLEAEIDNFLDPDLEGRVTKVRRKQSEVLTEIEDEVKADHAEEIEALETEFEEITAKLQDWETRADALWSTISEEMEERKPDLSDVEIPRSEAPGESDRFVLYDSTRDHEEQMDYYNQWKDGADGGE